MLLLLPLYLVRGKRICKHIELGIRIASVRSVQVTAIAALSRLARGVSVLRAATCRIFRPYPTAHNINVLNIRSQMRITHEKNGEIRV